jgi:Xaa-Pro dipeptidase
MTDGVVPISIDERKARIEKARKLMRDNRIDAIYVEPAQACFITPGCNGNERADVAGDSRKGEIGWCPKFEEERARELIKMAPTYAHGKKIKVHMSAW